MAAALPITMRSVQLFSSVYRVTAIKAKTKAKVIESVNVGDEIYFSMGLGPQYGHRGLHAVYITVHVIKPGVVDSGACTDISLNMLQRLVFDILELEVI